MILVEIPWILLIILILCIFVFGEILFAGIIDFIGQLPIIIISSILVIAIIFLLFKIINKLFKCKALAVILSCGFLLFAVITITMRIKDEKHMYYAKEDIIYESVIIPEGTMLEDTGIVASTKTKTVYHNSTSIKLDDWTTRYVLYKQNNNTKKILVNNNQVISCGTINGFGFWKYKSHDVNDGKFEIKDNMIQFIGND